MISLVTYKMWLLDIDYAIGLLSQLPLPLPRFFKFLFTTWIFLTVAIYTKTADFVLRLLLPRVYTAVLGYMKTIFGVGLHRAPTTQYDLVIWFVVLKRLYADIMRQEAREGKPAPNSHALFAFPKSKVCYLLSYATHHRPLVVNFGSSTGQSFVTELGTFQQLIEEFSDVVDFVVVYTEEAHALNEWHVLGTKHIRQHVTFKRRLQAVELLNKNVDIKCPILFDGMNNDVTRLYAAVPERLYIISGGIVKYQSGKGPLCYAQAMKQMRERLLTYLTN